MPQCSDGYCASWKNSRAKCDSVVPSVGNPLQADDGIGRQNPCRLLLGAGLHLQVHVFQSFAGHLVGRLWLPRCIPCLLSISREETMERKKVSIVSASVAILTMTLGLGATCKAQDQSQEPPREATTQAPDQQRQRADGERHGLPMETYAVAPGTKFLVRLEEELGTRGTQENAKFKVKTLEPLEAGSGAQLPSRPDIPGPLSHVEPAGGARSAHKVVTVRQTRPKI